MTMLRIKRLYTFIYQTFIPVFFMTYGITLFIFIIQFLWQYIADLVGKGLETSVILELFFYLTLSLMPRALPLGLLLASLMTFGNMGERLELLAIKASGVSLLKIMRPMIILVAAISIGCFFFLNNLNPKFTVKVTSLLRSIKMKAPELAIPEGSFYNLGGYSIYVKERNPETRMLYDVVIYDITKGGVENMAVDVCDSAFIQGSDSKNYITITMYNGQHFQNAKDDMNFKTSNASAGGFSSYMRESFKRKDVIVSFKDEFERIEESRYDNTHIAKDMFQLQHSVDTLALTLDSLNRIDRETVFKQSYTAHRRRDVYIDSVARIDSLSKMKVAEVAEPVAVVQPLVFDFDSIYSTLSKEEKADVLSMSSSEARGQGGGHLLYYHIEMPKPILQKTIRDHEIAWHRMFTIPFACLVFFFIGAPLGAIIRKGGLGVPVIISVLLFIFYYIIDNIGYKMARDAVWPIWQGMWLSASILFPLGVFLTYKSTKESDLFAPEKYKFFFRKLFFLKEINENSFAIDGSTIHIPEVEKVTESAKDIEDFRALSFENLADMAVNYRQYGHDETMRLLAIAVLHEKGHDVTEYVHDRGLLAMGGLGEQFKLASYWAMSVYALVLVLGAILILTSQKFNFLYLIPYGYAFIRGISFYFDFYARVEKRNKIMYYLYHTLVIIVTFVLYPFMFFFIKKNMGKQIEKRKKSSFTF